MCSDYPLSPKSLQNPKITLKLYSRCAHEGPDPEAGASFMCQVHTLLQINFSRAGKVHYDFFIMKPNISRKKSVSFHGLWPAASFTDPVQRRGSLLGKVGILSVRLERRAWRTNCPRGSQPRLSGRPMAEASRRAIPSSGVTSANRDGRVEPAANGNSGRRRPVLPRWKLGLRSVAREPRPPSRRPQPRSLTVRDFKLPEAVASRYSSPRAVAVGRARGLGRGSRQEREASTWRVRGGPRPGEEVCGRGMDVMEVMRGGVADAAPGRSRRKLGAPGLSAPKAGEKCGAGRSREGRS